jgi:hypothetical protein
VSAEVRESEKQCGLHIDNDGQCLDLPLVDKLIELLSKNLKVCSFDCLSLLSLLSVSFVLM